MLLFLLVIFTLSLCSTYSFLQRRPHFNRLNKLHVSYDNPNGQFNPKSNPNPDHNSNQGNKQHYPNFKVFEPNDLQIYRLLGRVEVEVDANFVRETKRELSQISPNYHQDFDFDSILRNGRAVTTRIFEAKLIDGTKCYAKEYLPMGFSLGRHELKMTSKLTQQWSSNLSNQNKFLPYNKQEYMSPPIPNLIGYFRTDERIENPVFRSQWMKRMPRARPPEPGNLWLVYGWDEATFRSIQSFPSLPQIVEGLDYFSKQNRLNKRWNFLRKIMFKTLETLDFLHRSGYSHTSLNSQSLWLTTTNQQDINSLRVKLGELWPCQNLEEMGPYGESSLIEDFYNVGLMFLELIIASYAEDANGALKLRRRYGWEKEGTLLTRAEEVNMKQLNQKEWGSIFEDYCSGDFQTLRELVGSTNHWSDAYSMLEKDEGLGWKFLFTLLARGRLVNDNGVPIRITARGLMRDHFSLFKDVLDD